VSSLGYENVGGLNIAMNDSFRMRGVQCVCNLIREPEQDIHLDRLLGDELLQGNSVQKLHHDEELSTVLRNLMDRTNIWMVQRRGCPGLATEAFQTVRILRNRF